MIQVLYGGNRLTEVNKKIIKLQINDNKIDEGMFYIIYDDLKNEWEV